MLIFIPSAQYCKTAHLKQLYLIRERLDPVGTHANSQHIKMQNIYSRMHNNLYPTFFSKLFNVKVSGKYGGP